MSWRDKHACTTCGKGYGYCAEGLAFSLKCCDHCDHPGRWVAEPWTPDDFREMWEGKEMPSTVREYLRRNPSTVEEVKP